MPRQDQETQGASRAGDRTLGLAEGTCLGEGRVMKPRTRYRWAGGQQATPRLQVLASRTWSRVHRPSDGRRLEKVMTFRPEGVDQA